MLFARLTPWAPIMLSVLRLIAALLFLEHGTEKLLGFPAGPMHPAFGTLSWFSGLIEVVGGVLLAIGLFSRAAAFLMSGEMAVGYFLVHAPKSFFPALNGGDAAVIFCFLFLYFVFAGPGPLSLDAAMGSRDA
jgi:putative oxidoreductase